MTMESKQAAGLGKLEDGVTGSGNVTRWVHPEDWPLTAEGSQAP
jgi:hypothetical protein